MKEKIKDKIQANMRNIYLLAIVIASVFMCVGYATVNNVTLDLAGNASIVASPTIYIFDADIDPTSNGNVAASEILLTHDTVLQSKVVLNNDVNSTLTMEITIKNDTNYDTFFDDVVYGNNFYDNNNIDFSLSGLVHSQRLSAHDSVTFTITFKYTDAYKATNPTTFTNTLNSYLNFEFGTADYVARIGNDYYGTLQSAISAVPTNNTQTTVEVLKDVSEQITVASGKNVLLDIGNYTIRNKGEKPIFEVSGTLSINNGTIASNTTQGAINVLTSGTLNVSGGTITNTGTKQAIYNNGGITRISGSPILSNVSVDRAVVHNLNNGTMYITGGTITSDAFSAVLSENGIVTIGTKDGTVSSTLPSLQGATYGLESAGNVNYYDGVIKGKTAAIYDETKVVDKEVNYIINHSSQTIGTDTYDVATLGLGTIVTFNGNGGVSSEPSRGYVSGTAIGTLPTAVRTDHTFNGWWTDPDNGTEVTSSYIVNSPVTLYAHWTYNPQIKYARIDSTEFTSIEDAWSFALSSNTTKTLALLRDCSVTSTLSLSPSKSMNLDLSGYTIETNTGTLLENYGTFVLQDSGSSGSLVGGKRSGNTYIPAVINRSGGTMIISSGNITSDTSQVVENSGIMNITGGTISIGDIAQGVVNNNAGGILNISGGTISATIAGSKRQAVYNKGTVNISGSAVLSSASTDRPTVHNDSANAVMNISGGTINSTNTNCQRGAVQNISGATVTITGGTIISASTKNKVGAVENAGTLTIGVKNGTINTSSPVLQGAKYGVYNSGTFKFYDGILKGIAGAYSSVPDEIETGSSIVTGSETIDGNTYETAYLN